MNAILTNASGAKALIVTRSLGRKKIDVITSDVDKLSASFFSKYSKEHFQYPPPKLLPLEFINVLYNYTKRKKIDVLMPINSTETLLVSKYKSKFDKYTEIPLNNYSQMMQLHDKEELMKIADEFNIRSPKTFSIKDIKNVRNIAKNIEYPAVIKLKDSTSSLGVYYAHCEDELVSKYKNIVFNLKLEPDNFPIVQEYIPGDGYGVSVLFNRGDLRAIFVHKRIREYPITGGPSTFRESIRHHEMENIAISLLKHFNWHGLAMVEFKLDKRTNKPVLIEVNPRFWGSINQAIASGVDFPFLLYKMATEGDIKPVLNYKIGVKTRFLLNDFQAFLSSFKESKSRLKVFKEFSNFEGIFKDDIFVSDDVLPALFYIYSNIKEFLGEKKNGRI